jgi:hypothetical protein
MLLQRQRGAARERRLMWESITTSTRALFEDSSLGKRTSEKLKDEGVRTSTGFQTFLHKTSMPIWFPLSNLHILSQHKVLSMLQMKRTSKGNIVWDENASNDALGVQGTHVTMESRSHFRIDIIGGSIAGLACAKELIQLASAEEIDSENGAYSIFMSSYIL